MIALMVSCNAQKKTGLSSDDSGNEDFVLLVEDAFFPTDSPITEIIRDTKALRTFFSKVNKTRKPGLPIPAVDFNTEMVLVACLGKTNRESQTELKILEESPEQLVIALEVGEKVAEGSVISYPFYVYKMPKTDVSVSFTIDKSVRQ